MARGIPYRDAVPFFAGGVFGAAFLCVPAAMQGSVLASCMGAALVAYAALNVFKRTVAALPVRAAAYAAFAPALLALGSAVCAGISLLLQLGEGFEFGTIGSYLLFGLAAVFGAHASARCARYIVPCIEGVGIAAALISIGAWLQILPPYVTASAYPQLTILLFVGMLVAATCADHSERKTARVAHLLLSLFMLLGSLSAALPEFMFIAPMTAVFAAGLVFVPEYVRDRHMRRPFAVALVLAALLCAYALGLHAASLPEGASVDIRPSLLATRIVIGEAYARSALQTFIGTGPATFPDSWDSHRPVEFNATPQWNIAPSAGYDTYATIALELGLLGLLILMALPVAAFLLRAGTSSADPDVRTAFASCALVVIALWTAMLCYPISAPLFVLGGFAFGVLVSGLAVPARPLHGAMKYGVLSACAAAGAALVAVGVLQVSALFYDRAGLAAVDADPAAAAALFERAARLWPGTVLYDKHLAVATARRGLRMSAGAVLPTSRDFGLFIFEQAGNAISRVMRLEPHAISTQLLKLDVYTVMAEAGVPEAGGRAEEALFALSLLRATRPDALYFEARLRFMQGDVRAARDALSQALILKPDYAEARALLTALEGR
jgi:hypothetical protein